MFPIGPGATTTENSAVVVAKPFIGTLRVDGGSLLTTGALIIAEASPFANASVVLDGVGSSVDIICDPGGNNWLNRLEFGAAGRGTLLISPAGRCCRLFTTQRPTPTLRSRVWRQVAPVRLAARQAWRTPPHVASLRNGPSQGAASTVRRPHDGKGRRRWLLHWLRGAIGAVGCRSISLGRSVLAVQSRPHQSGAPRASAASRCRARASTSASAGAVALAVAGQPCR